MEIVIVTLLQPAVMELLNHLKNVMTAIQMMVTAVIIVKQNRKLRLEAELFSTDLKNQADISSEALAKVDLLNQQLLSLRRQIAALNNALEASEQKDRASQTRIKNLGARLNAALARQVQAGAARVHRAIQQCADLRVAEFLHQA